MVMGSMSKNADRYRPFEPSPPHAIEARDVNVSYGDSRAVIDVSLKIPEHTIVALIGPSGCGKSTFLRSLNRMNDFVRGSRVTGEILFRGANIYDKAADPVALRRQIGMVFQKPNPFPTSIRKNITWGPKINGFRGDYEALVENSLKRAALWDEVSSKLDESGLALSGGQQQRLCIARAIAMDPDVILMDEPCSALDPSSTLKIENLLLELKERFTIVIVTHNMQQARRVSDYTAFMYQGELVEFGPTDDVFDAPQQELTRDYVSGRFG
jgi:phosphate transport system ATP-binding protein